MFKSTPLIATAIALMTAPAFAQDWTGFYGGAELGFADINANPGASNDGFIGGIVGGYDYDLGNGWVVGGGLDYDFADINVGGTTVEDIFRLKARGGYKVGNGLIYGTGGYVWADTDNAGDDNGYFIGAGYEHLVSANFSIGGEVLYHEFDNFGVTTSDLEATTVQVRGTYRF